MNNSLVSDRMTPVLCCRSTRCCTDLHHRTGVAYAPAVAETRLQAYRRRVLNEWVHRAWKKMNSAGAIAPGPNLADRVGSLIGSPPSSIYGERYIHIGSDTLVGIGATVTAGYSPDDHRVPDRALVIGGRCVIAHRASTV